MTLYRGRGTVQNYLFPGRKEFLNLNVFMKLKLCILSLLVALSSHSFSQQYEVKGIVTDTLAGAFLKNATVSVLNGADSTLYKFTRAAEDGSFQIAGMKPGDFILLVSYPSYADFVNHFTLSEGQSSLNFRRIDMMLKTTLLNEVLIRGQATAIKIKGDTTEFNASSFTIQPNDKVEDLLKKFPGIQIDKDGKITAQGKTVQKVLVDGEEFFGDDPTLVTKNLRADMVDKVQLFEKSSDQAAFTGVDDGEKTQTLNILLKEDKKQGYFGKVEAGAGNSGFYQGQGMFNTFKAKQKFSAYGTASNTGKTGLSWSDANRMGTNGQMEFVEDGIFMLSSGPDELESWGGRYDGEGLPTALNGGLHYDNKWNKDKESINANYKIGSMRVKTQTNTLSQNNLPSGIINSDNDQVTDNYLFRQRLDAIYLIRLDTNAQLKITADGTVRRNETENQFSSASLRNFSSLLNRSSRTLTNTGDQQNFNLSALYSHKLKKPGRNFSLNVSHNSSKQESEGYLKATNDFYTISGLLDSTELIDQLKLNKILNSALSSNLTFNEPLSKSSTMVFNYRFSLNANRADRKSYNSSIPGRYDQIDEEFSNDFEATQITHQGGATYNYKTAKTTFNAGTRINSVHFDQLEHLSNHRFKRNFINWNPQLNYQYKFSQQQSLRIGYSGNNTQPTVTQLQPVKVNNDPLNIPLGNPDLTPSFSNNFNLYYNSYKVMSGQSIYVNARYGFTENAIVNNTVTDSTGKTLFQSVNLSGQRPINYSAYLDFGRQIKSINLYWGLSLSSQGNTYYNYVNNELNKTNSISYNISANINMSKPKKYDFNLYGGPSYRRQRSSLQANVNNDGWTFTMDGSGTLYLPGKFQLQSSAEYQYQAATQSFNQRFSRVILNTSLNKSFFKDETLRIGLSGNDLLNQNTGFRRFATANMITQTSFNTIRRYFMLTATWDFNKMGGPKNN